MFLENKILKNNISRFRMINEGSGEDIIKRAIKNNEYLYILYEGDNSYRTILPLVIGITSKKGESYKLLRAWQEKGESKSNKKYSNDKGAQQSGWRLFIIDDKIKSVLPTGKRIAPNRIPPSFRKSDYNPDDSQMSSIILAAPAYKKNYFKTDGLDSIEDPNVISQTVSQSVFDTQTPKFRQFFKAAKADREIVKSEVESLYKLNKERRKKDPKKMLVVTNENGDFVLRDIKDKDKLPQDSIVGNLFDLYNNLVTSDKKMDKTFIDKNKDELLKNVEI